MAGLHADIFERSEAEQYIEQHKLHRMMGNLLSELTYQTPEDPVKFAIGYFARLEQDSALRTATIGTKLVKKANRLGLGDSLWGTRATSSIPNHSAACIFLPRSCRPALRNLTRVAILHDCVQETNHNMVR
eukprot:SAG31_NODE_10508_length_1130_cov_1.217265_1_plen_131_part_00